MGLLWIGLKKVAGHTCNRNRKMIGLMSERGTWDSDGRFGLGPGCIYWLL